MSDEIQKPSFTPVRVILVGLGGIGSKLAEDLARYMAFSKNGPKELILVDGDTYSQSNLERQSAVESDVGQPKAKVWAETLAREFKALSIRSIDGYIGESGVKKDNVIPIDKLSLEGSATLLGVDNHATRKLFSDYFEKEVQNGVLVSGGNNLVDGSVLVGVRVGGKSLTPPIDAFHPEIAKPGDKNPADLSCSELAKLEGGQQVIWANKMAACLIGNAFYAICEGSVEDLQRQSEIYFDVRLNAARAAVRLVPGKEVEEPKKEKPVKVRKSSKAIAKKMGAVADKILEEVRIVDQAIPMPAALLAMPEVQPGNPQNA